jgi:uncharacterized membrane protein
MANFPLPPSAFTGQSRVVEAGACFDWLRQGWAIFGVTPGRWILMSLFFLAALFLPLFVHVWGFVLDGLSFPFLAAGLFQVCRLNAEDVEARRPGWADFFIGFRRQNIRLLVLGILGMCAPILLMAVLPAQINEAGSGFAILGRFFMLGVLALLFVLPISMALWFAPALVLFHRMAALAALRASFAACLKNWRVFLAFGLLCSLMAFLALLPLGLGLPLLIPVLFGMAYTAYRDIFAGV